MSNERKAVIEKVKRLLALGTSNYEAEAQAAMTKAGKLMEEWGLNISDVDLADEEIIYRKIDTGTKNVPDVSGNLLTLARFTNCKVWISRPERRKYYKTADNSNLTVHVIGYEQDVEIFEHFYHVLSTTVVAEYNRFKKTEAFANAKRWEHGKRIRHSFVAGFVSRVNMTLDELADEADNFKTSNGTALVPLKTANVEDYFAEKFGIRLRKGGYRRGASSNAGYNGGRNAGSKVRFNAAVNGAGNGTKMIG